MATEVSRSDNTRKPNKTKTLYIWGLDKDLTQDVVHEEFSNCALVNRVTIIKDKTTQISKGFGYVECRSPDDATKAMKEMDGKVIGKNPVRIKYSFTDTPEWMKFLDSKGTGGEEEDRSRRGRHDGARGRGRGRVTIRRDFPLDGYGKESSNGRYEAGSRGGYEVHSDCAPRRHCEDIFYDRRGPYEDYNGSRPLSALYDNLYEKKLVNIPPYERRLVNNGTHERRVYDDLHEQRKVRVYDGRADVNPLEIRPIPQRDPYYDRLPSRNDLYKSHPFPRRDVYEDRQDLYRPSDRAKLYREHREQLPERVHLQPPATVDYRARSPVDRNVSSDHHYSTSVPKEDIRRVGASPIKTVEYRTYSVRESPGRPQVYEVPPKRIIHDSLPSRGPDPYDDPYARVDPR